MPDKLLQRLLRDAAAPELIEVLSERLSLSDLQSLLLEVYKARASQVRPSHLLEQYERNRFVKPSQASPRTLLEFDSLAFELCASRFEPIELSPVCPFGTVSCVSNLSQNNTLSTIRGTEVLSDSTNALALECAVRRRDALKHMDTKTKIVRLCASHRLVRTQKSQNPAMLAHFRLFALCSAGRDEGDYKFETRELAEHIRLYLTLLGTLKARGYAIQRCRVALTDFDDRRLRRLESEVLSPLRNEYAETLFEFAQERTTGRSYYGTACFHIYVKSAQNEEYQICDGGMTDWTQQIMGNQKERLFISGMGSERLATLIER